MVSGNLFIICSPYESSLSWHTHRTLKIKSPKKKKRERETRRRRPSLPPGIPRPPTPPLLSPGMPTGGAVEPKPGAQAADILPALRREGAPASLSGAGRDPRGKRRCPPCSQVPLLTRVMAFSRGSALRLAARSWQPLERVTPSLPHTG